jgi:dTDP-L-rhamnose 4-epimerase
MSRTFFMPGTHTAYELRRVSLYGRKELSAARTANVCPRLKVGSSNRKMGRRTSVLVTGGAGFIGSHLVDRLLAVGHSVRVLDSLEPQVHGSSPGYRNAGAEYLEGSVLDRKLLADALDGVERVVHLAAQVGVGQSMYEIARYVRDNSLGTATLLELMSERRSSIEALVVASSMSIYGEGAYECEQCGSTDAGVGRSLEALRLRHWEPVCRTCGAIARPISTPEQKRLECDSVYAISKRDQEELSLAVGRAYGIRTVALRFFNVYGPRQSLSNPYTGVVAIFLSRLLNDSAPSVFEDGLQSRDFVHVADVVQAIELALAADDVDGVALNVGAGSPTTVLDIARTLSAQLGVDIDPEIVQRFRHGDIRHCYADISAAKRVLGFRPAISLEDGLADLIAWTRREAPEAEDRTEASSAQLAERGLVV